MDIITIAEIGINHNGDVSIAKQLIDVAAEAGCTYVKFQKRDVENGGCYTKEELDAPRDSPWGKTNREQKLGLEFGLEQYNEIDAHCRQKGIGWFVSCWDEPSIDFMHQNFPGMQFHKVASAKLTDKAFLEHLVLTNKRVILSTGMSTSMQVAQACNILGDSLYAVMHCTSTYPSKPEELNISFLPHLRTLLDDIVGRRDGNDVLLGFSNHYSGLLWVPLSIAVGAQMLEFHITLDRTLYGSDQAASLEPDGVKKLMEYVRISSQMLGDGKKVVYDSEKPIIKKLRKATDF